jgi:hypothetical protein
LYFAALFDLLVYSAALFDSLDCDVNTTPNNYPLTEELYTLQELVNNMQADLLQSSLLIDHVKIYLEKHHL